MALEVNGDAVPYVKGETISELIARMNYVFPLLVIVVDGKTIPESQLGAVKIKDGSKIQILHLTSGG